MKYSLVLLLVLTTLLLACKNSQEQLIVKKWKTVDIRHTGLDRMLAEGQSMIDTMTNKNIMLTKYKTVDSCKKLIASDLQNAKDQMKQSTATTFLELKADGKAFFTSIEGTDSSAWHIEDGELVLEDGEVTDITTTTRMSITTLSESALDLLTVIDGDSIFTKMKPYKE